MLNTNIGLKAKFLAFLTIPAVAAGTLVAAPAAAHKDCYKQSIPFGWTWVCKPHLHVPEPTHSTIPEQPVIPEQPRKSGREIRFYNQAAPGIDDYLDITDVRVSPISSDTWGRNLLSRNVKNRNGMYVNAQLNGCQHDIRVTFSDGHINRGKIDFCVVFSDGSLQNVVFVNYDGMF